MAQNDSWLREWLGIAAELNHEVVQRWYQLWGPYYREVIVTLLSSRVTQRWLSDVTDTAHSTLQNLLNSPDDKGLHFEIDQFAESSGPRWTPLPKDVDKKKLTDPMLNPVNVAGNASRAAPVNLDGKNVVARFENGQLSVTLVSLGPRAAAVRRPANKPAAKSAKAAGQAMRQTVAAPPPSPPPGSSDPSTPRSYHLTFTGQDHEPIVVTVQHVTK
jgi:hypothetical protein